MLRRREASPLKPVVDDLVQVVSGVADASRFLMVVTDAEGVVLWRTKGVDLSIAHGSPGR